ncbi:MAG: TetR/AcrR family transcriptional regulator [Mycobacteriales bacterium]
MAGITARQGQPGRRRRGATLEDAILAAVWDELTAHGYAALTMEKVAVRAQTSKQVLYRRWRNRAELVLTAVRHRWSSLADDTPDTGTLRGDIVALLERMARRYREIGPDVAHGLMAEMDDLSPEFLNVVQGTMRTLLLRAEARGEVRLDAIPARAVTLPADLLRHEMLLTNRPVTEAAITEIVDGIYLPLLDALDARLPK